MKSIYKIILSLILLVIGSLFFFKYAIGYLLPFIIAVVVASLIEPAVELLEDRANFSRSIAIIIILLIIIILISLLLTICLSSLFVELDNLVNDLPSYTKINFKWLVRQNEELNKIIKELKIPESVQDTINNNIQYFYDRIKEGIQLTLATLLGMVKKLPKLVTTLLISLIATFFISRDKDLIIESCLTPIPKEWRDKIREVQVEIINAAVGFIRAELILISITTLIAIIGLIILGSSYSLVIGLVAGMLDLIPIIGPSLIFIPWGVYNLLVGNVGFGVGLMILYFIMGTNRQVMEAKVIGQNIGIHPLATLMSIYIGLQMFGITGLFIGPALVVVLKAILQAGFISIVAKE